MQKQRIRPLKITFDPEFKEKSAKDYSERAKYNNYECGRKVTEALSEILDKNFEVLEIGSGPGTLSVPLAKKVKKIAVLEFSEMAVDYLRKNIEESQIENIEIINKDWLHIDDREIKDGFDLVVCSHFLWQMEDLEKHLIKMENASKRYCCVIQPAGREAIVKEMWTKITGEDYKGQFDPEADYFVYLILRQWGRLVNTRTMEYNTERNFEQEVRYIASFIGKYVEVDAHIKELIEKYIFDKLKGEIFKKTSSAVVMWWELKRYESKK